jgi:hypothetical protein
MSYIITTTSFSVFGIFSYILKDSPAPFGLVDFILGVACLSCFTYFVRRNCAKQLWLRKNYPKAPDRNHGFWNRIASIAVLAFS